MKKEEVRVTLVWSLDVGGIGFEMFGVSQK